MSISLYPYQDKLVAKLRQAVAKGHKRILLVSPCGSGKCLGKDTPVMMYSGRIIPVQDIQIGDLLMGPDSTPRRVESLACGRELMYRVTPKKGDSYTVNESHILSVRMAAKNEIGYADGEIVNISVRDYLQQHKTFRHCAKGWRVPVNFPSTNELLRIPAYMMGVWLGDGTSRHFSITTGDPEIAQEVAGYAAALGMRLRVEPNSVGSVVLYLVYGPRGYAGRTGAPLGNALRSYGLVQNKHIPHRYKTGSIQERLEVLAGILDTDGHNTGRGFDLTLKSERLLDDVIFVARSLGFSAYKRSSIKKCYNNGKVGQYWRCSINGPVDSIPCRVQRKKAPPRRQVKNPLVTGLKVEEIGEGDYYGFELSGPDRLFLLGDFTVTHNTVIFAYLVSRMASRGVRSNIMVHRQELLDQVGDTLDKFECEHGYIAASESFDPKPLIHVSSVFTLAKRLPSSPIPDYVINDEAHHCIKGSTWNKCIDEWQRQNPNMVAIGVTATPERLDGTGLGQVWDVMIVGPSVAELIAGGYLCQYKMFAPPHPVDTRQLHTRMGDYIQDEVEDLVNKPTITGNAVAHYRKYLNGAPTIAFCVSRKHAHDVAENFSAAGFRATSIDGTMKKQERKQLVRDFGNGQLNVMTSCQLINEGFDCPGMHGAIILSPTQSLAKCLQEYGRTLRIAPDKQMAYILDHVANSTRHGLPCDEREWSLQSVAHKKRDKDKDDISIRQCRMCGAISRATAEKCGECGHVFEVKPRKIEEVEGELSEIDIASAKREKRKEQGMAADMAALIELGKMRGYSNPRGWAWMVYNARMKKRKRA